MFKSHSYFKLSLSFVLSVSAGFNIFILTNWLTGLQEIFESDIFYPWVTVNEHDGYFAPSANTTKFNPLSIFAVIIWLISFALLLKYCSKNRNWLVFGITTLFLQVSYLVLLFIIDKPYYHG